MKMTIKLWGREQTVTVVPGDTQDVHRIITPDDEEFELRADPERDLETQVTETLERHYASPAQG